MAASRHQGWKHVTRFPSGWLEDGRIRQGQTPHAQRVILDKWNVTSRAKKQKKKTKAFYIEGGDNPSESTAGELSISNATVSYGIMLSGNNSFIISPPPSS